MDNKDIKDRVMFKIVMSEIQDENIPIKASFINKKSIAVACACLIFTTGVVFAKDIENFIKDKFGLGKGVQTAVENGYIANSNGEFVKSDVSITDGSNNVLENANVGIKVNNFFMDDYNLSVEFDFQFDENSKKIIEKYNINNTNINLSDLIVIDNEEKIIFSCANEEDFNSFCNEKNLDYKYLEFDENYMNSGLNKLINEDNLLTYNVYAQEKYPKSKELEFYFSKIEIVNITGDNKTIFNGNWKLHLDIPEYMYSRKPLQYKMVSCENDKFDIYKSEVTDMGFELGIIISDVEKPIYPKELEERENKINNEIPKGEPEFIGYSETGAECYQVPVSFSESNKKITTSKTTLDIDENSEYGKMYEEYYKKYFPIGNTAEDYVSWLEKSEGNYIINSKNNKYIVSSHVGGDGSMEFIEGNKYNYCAQFEMTKYDATDKITAVIDFYGEPVKIELEKIDK